MKNNRFALKIIIVAIKSALSTTTKRYHPALSIIMLSYLLSACQITAIPANDGFSFSQYYLWLKTLTNEELAAEEDKQKLLMASMQEDDKAVSSPKLILIYSLPNTSVHQPYKAKSLLNKYSSANKSKNDNNHAFALLLNDQLNSQLALLTKLAAANKNTNRKQQEQIAKIKQLTIQLEQTNKQLILLKQIEQNINKRG